MLQHKLLRRNIWTVRDLWVDPGISKIVQLYHVPDCIVVAAAAAQAHE